MSAFVVDTNVAIVANGGNKEVGLTCQRNCVEKLESLVKSETIVVDEGGLIVREYRKHLSPSGSPRVGDIFFKHVWDEQYSASRVQRVAITPTDDQKGFEELPKNKFDRSDRKFLAVAVKAKAVVLNATDSDWKEHEPLMKRLGVKVHQLCPQHASK